MQTKKRKTALIWWVVALIILSVMLLTSATIYMFYVSPGSVSGTPHS